MTIKLLLDTCILKNLVSNTEFSYHLRELDYLVKNNHVNLLVPEILKKEWKKHREEEKNKILFVIKNKEKDLRNLRMLKDQSAEFQQGKIDEIKVELLSQLNIIDELLIAYGTNIETDPAVLILIHQQRRDEKKPFGTPGKDNTNDAEIIFTSLEYLKRNDEAELYFVSANTSEFAAGKKPDILLHPDIASVFPSIKIYYFTAILEAFNQFDRLNIPKYKKDTKPNRVSNTIQIDKSKPALDQLHEYFAKRSEQLSVIPKKLLTEHYPIIVADSFKFFHKPFTLITDNKELFQLLSTVEVIDGSISDSKKLFIKNEEDEKKIKEIFNYLHLHYLERVAFENGEATPIKYSAEGSVCNCAVCLCSRLSFGNLLKNIDRLDPLDSEDSIRFKLKQSYVHYKLGNFIESINLLKALYDERKDQKDLINYIICFNLVNLRPLLDHYFYDNQQAEAISKELKEIDLENTYKDCSNVDNIAVLKWIHEKRFYKESFADMHEKVESIKDHFHSQSRGFNDNTRDLMENYLSAENFISRNAIIFDVYSEFESLTNLFTEGLLASYGCNHSLGGKLQYLTDTILEKLVLYGKAADIKKYYSRYKLNNMAYGQNKSDGSCFTDLVESVLADYPLVSDHYDEYIKNKNEHFWFQYKKIIYNILTLVAIAQFENPLINRFSRQVLAFLAVQTRITDDKLLKAVKFFLHEKREIISDEILHDYFILGLQKELFRTDDYLESLAALLNNRKIKISMSQAEFDIFKLNFFEHPKFPGGASWFSIGYIFSILSNTDQQKEIIKFITESLGTGFVPFHYYLATMFEMILPQEDYTMLYINHIEGIIAKGPQRRLFDDTDYYTDSRVTDFFNFCYKYEMDIPVSIQQHLPAMGDYYSWLNDMDNFDYAAFNTAWLDHNFTIFFKKKYRKCSALKAHLLNLIRKQPDKEIERLYITTYCFDE